jgi:hypothetical protein
MMTPQDLGGLAYTAEPLLFTNPEFRYDEPNVTVRMGRKWADKGLRPGTIVELRETDGLTYGDAVWLGCMVLAVADLKHESILALEHDPDCVTFEGIVAELCSVYDLAEIDEAALVTVCIFRPIAGMLAGNNSRAA